MTGQDQPSIPNRRRERANPRTWSNKTCCCNSGMSLPPECYATRWLRREAGKLPRRRCRRPSPRSLGRIRLGDHLPERKLALYEALRAAIELRTTPGETPSEIGAQPGYELPDLDAPLRAAEVREQMLRLVSSREFEMLQLRAEGFSYVEIARVLSISPGTVASSLARAFRKIRTGYHAGTQS